MREIVIGLDYNEREKIGHFVCFRDETGYHLTKRHLFTEEEAYNLFKSQMMVERICAETPLIRYIESKLL